MITGLKDDKYLLATNPLAPIPPSVSARRTSGPAHRNKSCGAFLAGLLVIGLVFTGGCRRLPESHAPSGKSGGKETTAKGTLGESNDDDAARFLSSVVNLLKGEIEPGTYTSAVIQLNKFVQRRPGAIADLSADQRTQVTRTLGAGNVAIAQRKTFAEDDIEFLRNAFFIRQVARRLNVSSTEKVASATALFLWTCDEVSLTAPGEHPAVPPIETLLRGFGQPEERVAIFLELLRQSDLFGGVLAVTTKEDPESLTPWLVGMIDGEEMYLFDPLVGRPVPSPADPLRAATLRELSANPTIATRWYTPAHPMIDPTKIDRYAVLLAVEASQLASRMAFLQSNLVGKDRVNLYQDIDASVRRANQVLTPIAQQVGVQVWHFPEETGRAFLAKKRATSEGLVRWQQIRHRPRLAALEGRWDDAIKEVVNLDLNPIHPVVWDISIQPLKLSFAESRRLIAHSAGSNAYVGATTQRSSHPNDPAYADEWLARFFKKQLDPSITPSSIFEMSILGRQLVGHPDRARQPLEERIFSLLPEPAQKLARIAADDLERAKVVPAPAAEAQPTVSIPEPLKPAEVSVVVGALDGLLSKPDLIDTALAEPLKKEFAVQPVVLSKDPLALTPEEVRWRNRLLFDRVFLESVVPVDRPWITGALRMKANILIAAGNKEEAITLLEGNYPMLSNWSIASLRADANRLKEK
jgi:hypothetical protein